jgi:hypothetical protein
LTTKNDESATPLSVRNAVLSALRSANAAALNCFSACTSCRRNHDFSKFESYIAGQFRELGPIVDRADRMLTTDILDELRLAIRSDVQRPPSPPKSTTWHEEALEAAKSVFFAPVLVEVWGEDNQKWLNAFANDLRARRPNNFPEIERHVVDEATAYEHWKAANRQPPTDGSVEPDDTQLSKEALAIAALKDHPGWTHKAIASAAGCHEKTLFKFPAYMAARELLAKSKENIPRGYKDSDGSLESWRDE